MDRKSFGFYHNLMGFPKVTVGEISGYALGGGFEMALMTDISVIARDTKIGMPATRFLGPALGSLHMFFHRLGPVLARRMLLTGDIIDGRRDRAPRRLHRDVRRRSKVTARARYWAEKAAKMPADGVVIAKEAFRLVEQSQAYQGEEVASYLFHAYGTNLQFARGRVQLRQDARRSTAPRRRSACVTSTSTCPNRSDGPSHTGSNTVSDTFVTSSNAQKPRSKNMGTPVIVGAARTAIGRSFKGTLVNTPPETLITTVLPEVVRRSGVDPADIDDIIFAESHYGGGDLARYAATATGLEHVPGQSVNRHCAGSLTAIGNASAQIGSGMERALIAGGVQSLSMTPLTNWRIPGPELKFEERWMPPTHVETPDAPAKDMSITVGWNTAQSVGITREEMDAWAARSHQRAIAAMDAGKFLDEIIPLKVEQFDGSVIDFSVDEHPAP